MSEWISVDERLPSMRTAEVWNYFIICVDGIVAPGIYYFKTGWRTASHSPIIGTVTHWQPLPDPPEAA